jgi:hypothetical protein
MATFKSPVWKRRPHAGFQSSEEVMKADKDYFLDENDKLAKTEKDAAFLLVRKGQEISAETAKKYGIGAETKTETAKKGGEK